MAASRGRIAALAAAFILTTALTGCTDRTARPSDDTMQHDGPRLHQALAYLPANSQSVSFTDRSVVAERLGLEDVTTGDSAAEVRRWSKAVLAEGYPMLVSTAATAMNKAAFSVLDVEWLATGGDADWHSAQSPQVWRMSDGLDFNAVAADLEDAGFRRSGPDERPGFRADFNALDDDLMFGGRYPVTLVDLTLLPQQRLILIGLGKDAMLDVIDGTADSLADAGVFDDHLAQTEPDGLEYAIVGLTPPCSSGGRLPDGRGVGLFAHPDEPTRLLRLFGSTESAHADAARLEDELAQHPVTVGVEGASVHVDIPFADRIAANKTYFEADGPLGCRR